MAGWFEQGIFPSLKEGMEVATSDAIPRISLIRAAGGTWPSLGHVAESDIYSAEVQASLTRSLQHAGVFAGPQSWISEALTARGVCILDEVDVDHDPTLVALAAVLGFADAEGNGWPARTVSPISYAGGPSVLLSHGRERFDLHTDSCFMEDPHRYLVMAVAAHDSDGGGETLLRDGHDLLRSFSTEELDELSKVRIPFSSDGTDGPSLVWVPIVERRSGTWLIRYRRDVIVRSVLSLDNSQSRLFDKFEAAMASDVPMDVLLHRGSVIILDNWRFLHGRGAFSGKSGRLLKRLKVR
ncbi:TauD/TfdA family dioxygenase [Streptomyces sp. NPDC059445]|uniref:TauD/TfdA family dioxygenase n=1 Tax=Streptomyces sp. NPDC059445 TaxID=3346832 RepID=UPI00367FFB8E